MPESLKSNRYVQVARTYCRRMFYFAAVIALLLLVAQAYRYFQPPKRPMTVSAAQVGDTPIDAASLPTQPASGAASASKDNLAVMIQFQFFGLGWILLAIITHLKRQIASPAATVIPGYRLPHILVAGVFTAIVLILLPVAIALGMRLPPLSLVATAGVFGAAVLWCFYLQHPVLTIASIILWLAAFFTPHGRSLVFAAITSTSILPNIAALGASVLAMIGLAMHMLKLREDSPVYARQLPLSKYEVRPTPQAPNGALAANVNYQNILLRLCYAPAYRGLSRLAQSPPTSYYARLKRWQLGQPAQVAWIFAPFLLIQVFFVRSHGGRYDMLPLMFQLVIFPSLVLPAVMHGTWRTLAMESLRPVSRREYLQQRALALALQLAEFWLGLSLLFVLCAAVLNPAELQSASFWLMLAATGLAQIPLFAACMWLLRFGPSASAIFFGSFVGIAGFGAAALVIESSLVPSPTAIVIAMGIALALSVLLLLDARRRWLKTDLA